MVARPPGIECPETIDDPEIIDIDQTAPPQLSPLRGATPFGPTAPAQPLKAPAAPPRPGPLSPPRPAPAAPPHPGGLGEETAPPQRSPLAAALPFRHAKAQASTVAIPIPTPEDLRRLAQGGQPAPAPPPAPAADADARARAERARMEAAKTVGFMMPEQLAAPPPGGGPVAASSTGHFGISIEQYAALCAEVAVSPHTAESTFAKYGLAERRERLTADLAWQERLRDDAALMQKWQSLYLHYHEYYSRPGNRQ